MTLLPRLFARLFPKHEWVYSDNREYRRCTICRQMQEFDEGSGFSGSLWLTTSRGDSRKHGP